MSEPVADEALLKRAARSILERAESKLRELELQLRDSAPFASNDAAEARSLVSASLLLLATSLPPKGGASE